MEDLTEASAGSQYPAYNFTPLATFGNVEAKAIHEPLISQIARESAARFAPRMRDDGIVPRLRNHVARRGGEQSFYLVAAGILDGNDPLIDKGMRGNETGAADFDANGIHTFSDDRPHMLVKRSTIFLHGAVRAVLLLLTHDNVAPVFRERALALLPKMHAIVSNLATPENVAMIPDIAPNRGFLAGAVFQEIGLLTGDDSLVKIARQVMENTLTLQRNDGVFPEKGGSDTAYHSLSLFFLCRYVAMAADPEFRSIVLAAGQRGMDWLTARIDDNGVIDVSENTRVGPKGAKFLRGQRGAVSIGGQHSPQHIAYFGYLTGQQDKYYPIAAKVHAMNKQRIGANEDDDE
ncbi:MAG TPA: hypothetical protein VHL34_21380 [Rhizomicrobium sp.]|jgi:hypothetical protein|nr:hypothetical protein [Rhizomicrobium sp.]